MNRDAAKLRSWVWLVTLATAAATALACHLSGLVLAQSSRFLLVPFALASLGCIVLAPGPSRPRSSLLSALEGLLLFTLISTLGAVLSYLAMLHSSGFADPLLDRWDRALGFNWLAIRQWVLQHTWLHLIVEKAYFACFWMPFLLVGLLWHADRVERLYRYLVAHGLALGATVAIFFFFPARAAFAFYLGRGAPLPGNARHYGDIIAGLRDGSMRVLDLGDLGGIITFPSFHAAMAILFVWGAWPARRFRVPMIVVNLLMWLAAVPFGGHYAVDILAGSAIAVAAIAVARKLARSSPETPPPTATEDAVFKGAVVGVA